MEYKLIIKINKTGPGHNLRLETLNDREIKPDLTYIYRWLIKDPVNGWCEVWPGPVLFILIIIKARKLGVILFDSLITRLVKELIMATLANKNLCRYGLLLGYIINQIIKVIHPSRLSICTQINVHSKLLWRNKFRASVRATIMGLPQLSTKFIANIPSTWRKY